MSSEIESELPSINTFPNKSSFGVDNVIEIDEFASDREKTNYSPKDNEKMFADVSNIKEEKETHCESPESNTSEDGLEWLDIIGSGDFKKRVLKSGEGVSTRPQQGNLVVINYTCFNQDDTVIEEASNFELVVGDFDIVQGIDLALPLMEVGETAEILIPSRLAFGKVGRPPEIQPDVNLRYIVEILESTDLLEKQLSLPEILKFGNKKRDRGNYWYSRGEYLTAVHCYQRAVSILDGVHDGSESSAQLLQDILDIKIKVHNNMAASQLKLEAYDQALKSVDFVLRIQVKNVKAHYRKAKILLAKGQTDEAFASMKKAAELEPETKFIQQELQKVVWKKNQEEKHQRAMYKRMFPESASVSKSSKRWMKPWRVLAGSCLALAVGVAAYRQYLG